MRNDSDIRQLIIANQNNENDENRLTPRSRKSKFMCVVCKKPTLLCCSDCQDVFYCSLLHQQLDWKAHTSNCKKNDNQLLRTNYIPSNSEENLSKENRGPIYAIETSKLSDISMNSKPKYDTLLTEEKSPAASFERDKIEYQLSEFNEERNIKLKEVLLHYVNLQNNQAMIKAKKLFQISKKIFEISKTPEPYTLIADGMMFVKTFLRVDKLQNAREVLLEIWEIALNYINDEKIANNLKISGEGADSSTKYPVQRLPTSSFNTDESLSLKIKNEINKKINERKILKTVNLYSTFGSLFYSVGDFNNCEKAYVKYTKLIENNFGGESYEASNCFFLLGVFYLQHLYYVKAMACFKKALNIRIKKLGDENHECIADCYYNIGIVYKQNEKFSKAISSLNTALKIRASLIGEISLPVAQVLEILGKVYLKAEDYMLAFHKMHDCLNIRRKLLKNPQHIEIIRVTKILQDLFDKIQNDLQEKNLNLKLKEVLGQVKKQMIQSKSLDGLFSPDFEHKIRNETLKDQIPNQENERLIVQGHVNEEYLREGSENVNNLTPEKSEFKLMGNDAVPTFKPNILDSNPSEISSKLERYLQFNHSNELKLTINPDINKKERILLENPSNIESSERFTFHPENHPIIEFATSSETNKDTENNKDTVQNTQRDEEFKSHADIFRPIHIEDNFPSNNQENAASTSSLNSQISGTRDLKKHSNKTKGLILENKLLQELDTDRILELNELKSVIKQKKYVNVSEDIIQSEFYKNLDPAQQKILLEDNKHLFPEDKYKNVVTFRENGL